MENLLTQVELKAQQKPTLSLKLSNSNFKKSNFSKYNLLTKRTPNRVINVKNIKLVNKTVIDPDEKIQNLKHEHMKSLEDRARS